MGNDKLDETQETADRALKQFDEWLQGRQITDGLLTEYITPTQ